MRPGRTNQLSPGLTHLDAYGRVKVTCISQFSGFLLSKWTKLCKR
jgi:hypothetical protein